MRQFDASTAGIEGSYDFKLQLEVVESISAAYVVARTFSVTIFDFLATDTAPIRHLIGSNSMTVILTPFTLTYNAGFTTLQ